MAATTDPQAAPTLSEAAAEVLERSTRVALPTDGDADGAVCDLREAMIDLAVRFDLDVVLYDRSDETWMDHPHPKGPLGRDDIDADERPHLVEQLDEFAARGVTTSAWIATVPSLTEIVDVIHEVDVDAIIVPDHGNGTKLLDRLKSGGPAEIVERIATLNLEDSVPVLVQRDDGSIAVAESPAR